MHPEMTAKTPRKKPAEGRKKSLLPQHGDEAKAAAQRTLLLKTLQMGQ